MKRYAISFCLLISAFCFSEGQTTHNLEIIFQRGIPDTSLRYWGAAIAGVGDVNGDGYDDVAVGCFRDVLEEDTAKVFIYYGSTAIDTVHDLLISNWSGGTGGLSICGADINGDGYRDICMTARGRVYIHFGGNPPSIIPSISFGGRVYESYSAIASGDLNGDDTTDLIVGDFWNMSGSGHVNIYLGSAVFDTLPWLVIRGHSGEEFGFSLAANGDVNKDGYNDLSVGAMGWGDGTNGPFSAGRLYVFYGGNPMDTVPDMWKDGEGANQSWGWMNLGIMPNDSGYDRVGIGCCLWPNGFMVENSGKCYIFNGGNPVDSIPDVTIIGNTDSSNLGYWNNSSGDIDSNIIHDWASIASGENTGYLWQSKVAMDSTSDGWITYNQIGRVAAAGDVNNDGRDEVIFSNYAAPSGQQKAVICKYTGPNGVSEKPFEGIYVEGLRMFQNVPNPFNKSTTIKYQITVPGQVILEIYNVAGQRVRTIVDEFCIAGSYAATWSGRDEKGGSVSSGVYFYRLGTCYKNIVRKMIILK